MLHIHYILWESIDRLEILGYNIGCHLATANPWDIVGGGAPSSKPRLVGFTPLSSSPSGGNTDIDGLSFCVWC